MLFRSGGAARDADDAPAHRVEGRGVRHRQRAHRDHDAGEVPAEADVQHVDAHRDQAGLGI